MACRETKKIIADVRCLKVQGACAVAQVSLRALVLEAENSKAKTVKALYSELEKASIEIANARPTEPLVRNTIRNILTYIGFQIKMKKISNPKQLVALLKEKEGKYFEEMETAKNLIADCGSKLIPKKAHILTHCHSSTVMEIIKRAHAMGKDIKVTCTETRPRFQGRLTAKELRDAGIPVRMIVDSAVKNFLIEIDIVVVGADAITATGDLVNKIGTHGIAALAFDMDIPLYSAAELHKFDPLTKFGCDEQIEERDVHEVVDNLDEFRGVEIRNPAFDKTPAKYIEGYITEEGLIPPQSLPHIFQIREGKELE